MRTLFNFTKGNKTCQCATCRFTSLYINVYDFNVLEWFIKLVRLHILDRVHYLKAPQHTAEDRMLVVQPRRRGRCNEELGTIRVRTGVSHTHRVWPIR